MAILEASDAIVAAQQMISQTRKDAENSGVLNQPPSKAYRKGAIFRAFVEAPTAFSAQKNIPEAHPMKSKTLCRRCWESTVPVLQRLADSNPARIAAGLVGQSIHMNGSGEAVYFIKRLK